MDRLEQLQRLLEKSPTNTFAHYGVAMEYRSRDRLDKAAEWFQRLLELEPDYRAAFFQYGRTLIDLNRGDEAAAVLRRGITVCKEAGDAHAAEELQELLNQEEL